MNDEGTPSAPDAPHSVPIVGIGASAGGLEALVEFISAMPPPSQMAFVIVQHLAPDQKSILHELLDAKTSLPVAQLEDGQRAQLGHVYVVPPGKVATVDGQTLRLIDRDPTETQFRPIDRFFSSLAEQMGRDAYCVILSGTGSDGSAGLRAIKTAGGFALVQESTDARFPGMPDAAVATGLVDFVLPARQIAERIAQIVHHRRTLADDADNEALRGEIETALPEITARLAEVIGHDFSDYKPGTLIRRIERRMTLLRHRNVDGFRELLQKDEQQATLLAQEFLIGVTEFFRDPEAFEALREHVVIPTLERARRDVRVWVPGCSTGEEAYSIAILFMEEMERRGEARPLQVFGTDIDTHALLSARYGRYSAPSLAALGEKRLNAFFRPEGSGWRARSDLREACVFAPHNLVQDPPFSRLDLISCRNLLIYLSSTLQRRVIPRFHFSLRRGGMLFLGPSEGLAGDDELFETVEKTHRIFRRNDGMQASYSALADPPSRARVRTLPQSAATLAMAEMSADLSREVSAEREFLRQYAAPFAMISPRGEVSFVSQAMTDLVRPAAGTPSSMIDTYLAPELRVPVRAALAEAERDECEARIENVVVSLAGEQRMFDVMVAPVRLEDVNAFMLVLKEVRPADTAHIEGATRQRDLADRNLLETENISLRKQLAAVLAEHETSGQELKSTNEELMSMNEELQSSNEELETSREELQSINEELETVNAELRENNRQLTRANSDLKNLFESTDIAVLFLDTQFCVRNFTPPTAAIFGIKGRDIGRPISDLSSRIDYPEFEEDAARVEETLQTVEREVSIPVSGETFILRMKPYRTTDNRIDGYVLSFVDITTRKNAEETLQRNERDLARQYAELENLYDTTPVGLALVGRGLEYLRVNATIAEIDGFAMSDYDGKTIPDLLPDLEGKVRPMYETVFAEKRPVLGVEVASPLGHEDGEMRHFLADFYPVLVEDEVYAVGVCVREVTEQARMIERITEQNEHQRLLLGELQHRVKNTLATISAITRMLLPGSDSAAMYEKRLTDRLRAIARTHDLLTDAEWIKATLADIVAAEATPYQTAEKPRVKVIGPEIDLSAMEATSIGMAVHELMTNAAKHGALSADGGSVTVSTAEGQEGERRTVRIRWEEQGGPEVVGPDKETGFGSLVLNRVLTTNLDAEVSVEYRPAGLVMEVTFEPELNR